MAFHLYLEFGHFPFHINSITSVLRASYGLKISGLRFGIDRTGTSVSTRVFRRTNMASRNGRGAFISLPLSNAHGTIQQPATRFTSVIPVAGAAAAPDVWHCLLTLAEALLDSRKAFLLTNDHGRR